MPGRSTPAEIWFRPRAFERDGRVYRWLGVLAFKRLLMRLVTVDPASPTGNAYVLAGRNLAAVRAFERRSRHSEVVHLVGLLFGLVFLLLGALFGGLLLAGAIVFLANFHCFALQRYNRARVYRVLARARRRG